jgi:4-hydroxybenzoate polyprenyltransferase
MPELAQPTVAPPHPTVERLRLFASDIKISHTIFAMPWAILATVMAWRMVGGPLAGKLGLIVVCMVTARTVAMAANRLLDAKLDALNPRTVGRALPSGKLSVGFVAGLLALSACGFVAATAAFHMLYANPWPLWLSVPVLAFVALYPLLKRFTRLCHYYLGAALALAPICAWIAVSGGIASPPLIMAGAILLWTAGFDIIYACQDVASDRASGLFSIPAALGIGRALWVSRVTHVICVGMLILLGLTTPPLGAVYFAGVGIAIVLLAVEHWMVRPHDLSRVGLAFFTLNGVISLLLGALGIVDVLY